MAKAKTVKTTTVEEKVIPEPEDLELSANAEAQPMPSPMPVMPFPDPGTVQEEEDLKNFFEGLGGSEVVIKISKYDAATNRPRYLQDTDLEGAREAYIQENWGEGRYLLRAYKEGRVIGSKTVLIGPPLAKNAPAAPAPAAAPLVIQPQGMDPIVTMQLEQMREEQRTNREILLKMIDKMGNSEKSGATEIAEIMAILKPVITPQPTAGGSALSVLSEAIPLVRQLIDLGAGQGGGGEKPSWMSMVKDLAPDVLRTMGQMAMAKNAQPAAVHMPPAAIPSYPQGNPPPAQVTAAAEISDIDPEQLAMVRQAISFLKSRARKNAPPDTFINYVIDTLDDEQSMGIAKLLDRSYEDIAAIDPEILSAVYRPWFEEFFGGLKDALSERNDPGGEGSNDPNPAENAGTDSSSRQE